MDSLPSPRLLTLFLLVADELHFGRAARRARLAQPALSRQIRDLEQQLGFPLFERTSRHVAITPAGEAFRADAAAVLAALRASVDAGRLVASGARGRLRIGYSTTAMLTVLPHLVRSYQRRYPDVRLVLRELSSAPQLDALTTGVLDVAFVGELATARPRVRVMSRWPDRLALAVPADSPLRRVVDAAATHPPENGTSTAGGTDDGRAHHPARLGPLIVFPRSQAPSLHDRLLQIWQEMGGAPVIAQYGESWHTVLCLVAAGLGMALVPGSVRALRVPGVRLLPVRRTDAPLGVSLCVATSPLSPPAEAFLSMALSTQEDVCR